MGRNPGKRLEVPSYYSRVIIPINGLLNWVNWGYFTPINKVVTLFTTGRGPPCNKRFLGIIYTPEHKHEL